MRFVIAAAALALFAVPAHASGPFNVTGTTVLTAAGEGGRLHQGANTIGQPTQMNCVSAAGCSVVIQSKMDWRGTNSGNFSIWCIRALVDDIEAEPSCRGEQYIQGHAYDTEFKNLDVAQGMHTVKTELVLRNTSIVDRWKGKLYTWAIVYTMYDH